MALVIDAQVAGISGDMLLCSLVHMGADAARIESGLLRAASALDGEELRAVRFERTRRHGIDATALRVDSAPPPHSRPASELEAHIVSSASVCGLSEQASSFAAKSIRTLIAAESKVHGVDASSTHLHEAAGIDTLVDILGTAMALDDLDLFSGSITCTPVAVGGGLLDFSHGTTSNPASAILEILRGRGIEMRGGPVDAELTTPTGASMLVNLASSCSPFYPPLVPSAIGYGAGKAEHDVFANVLKIVRGEEPEALSTDTVRVLETNLDDVTGETIGHTIDALMQQGALDVSVSQAITKKNRPAHLVSVMCDADSYDNVLRTLMAETGTLGVRVRDSQRVIAKREILTRRVQIDGREFDIRYKVTQEGVPKIEHDDVQHVASAIDSTLHIARRFIEEAISRDSP